MKNLTTTIINKIKPQVKASFLHFIKMVEFFNKIVIPNTKREREYYEANVTFKLIRSLEIYTQPSDKIVEFSVLNDRGNFAIELIINRGGTEYFLNTETIIADGCINVAHYRYITKSDLPKTGNKTESLRLEKKLKEIKSKNNKIDRTKEDIKRTKDYIVRLKKQVSEFNKLTKQQKVDKILKECPQNVWSEMNDFGREYYKTPENLKMHNDEMMKKDLKEQKRRIDILKNYRLKDAKKDLNKYQDRLKQLK